jgi:hypothetical protein
MILTADNSKWVNPDYAVEPGTPRGYDGFEAAARALTTVYPDFRVFAVKFYDVATPRSHARQPGGFRIDGYQHR